MRWPVIVFLIVLVCFVSSDPISVCITNCAQCKRMLGPYFQGPVCAESCVLTLGLKTPDCNNPSTIKAYLRRLY